MSQIMTEHITIRSAVPENMAKKIFYEIMRQYFKSA